MRLRFTQDPPRTLCMTFGRPPTIPNEYMKLELPVNQSLEKIAMATTIGNAAITGEGPTQSDTVCFYIATMYVFSTPSGGCWKPLTHFGLDRQLYYVLGDIISQLYGSNIDADPCLSVPTMLERSIALEQKLMSWKRNLFVQLQRRPWDTLDPDGVSVSSWDPVFDRLSVIITLRYLNARILLHRPVLSAFLRKRAALYRMSGGGAGGGARQSEEEEDPFFHDLSDNSINICERSAMEIVQIVYKTSRPPALLGAWWFSAYYSE